MTREPAARLIDSATWTMAGLLVATPSVMTLAIWPDDLHVPGFAAGALVAMCLLHLGLVVAPVAARQGWPQRFVVALLMAPAAGLFALLAANWVLVVTQGRELDEPAWGFFPVVLALCLYLATLVRLLVAGTPVGGLFRPTPRVDAAAR